MRSAPSDEERIIWQALRQRKVGVAFRRQVPLEGFIVDLLAQQLWLVVEVDGAYHRRRRAADRRRDEKLRRAGYHVLRIDAELIRRDLAAAIELIRTAVSQS